MNPDGPTLGRRRGRSRLRVMDLLFAETVWLPINVVPLQTIGGGDVIPLQMFGGGVSEESNHDISSSFLTELANAVIDGMFMFENEAGQKYGKKVRVVKIDEIFIFF